MELVQIGCYRYEVNRCACSTNIAVAVTTRLITMYLHVRASYYIFIHRHAAATVCDCSYQLIDESHRNGSLFSGWE